MRVMIRYGAILMLGLAVTPGQAIATTYRVKFDQSKELVLCLGQTARLSGTYEPAPVAPGDRPHEAASVA